MRFAATLGKASACALMLAVSAQSALAQRPPSGNQAPGNFSIEGAWTWLTARPGAVIAIVLIIAAIGYMLATRNKSRT